MKTFRLTAFTFFLLSAPLSYAQTAEPIYLAPTSPSYTELVYPYYEITLEPSRTDSTDTTQTSEPADTTDTTTNEPASTSTTEPSDTTFTAEPSDTTTTTNTTDNTQTTEPTDTTTTTTREPTDSTTNATTADEPVSSGTLFVPPEREIPGDEPEPTQPRDPQQPEEPEEPRECPEPEPCPSSREVIERTLPGILTTQWRAGIIVFLGAAAGAVLWAVISLFFNRAHVRREKAMLVRRAAFKRNNQRLQHLKHGHDVTSESIADLSATLAEGKQPSSEQVRSFKQASTELLLFGSVATRKAQQKVIDALQDKKTTAEKFNTATQQLSKALKKDLGLT